MSYNRKELVDWVRGIYQNLNKADKQDALRFFPELRGSEDEKIRQQLLWLCKEWEHNPDRRTIPADIDNIKQIRRYLERQKEQKPIKWNEEDENIRKQLINICDEWLGGGYSARLCLNDVKWLKNLLEKQKEQKSFCLEPIFMVGDVMRTWQEAREGITDDLPVVTSIDSVNYICTNEMIPIARQNEYEFPPNNHSLKTQVKEQKPAEWSEEDEKMRNLAIEWTETMYGQFRFVDMGSTDFRKIVAWLKSLHPQPKQEWSEENEDMLNSCISSIEEAKENRYAYRETDGDTSYDHEISWLKSLRPSWKPSKEQMKALEQAKISAVAGNYITKDGLCSLYEQLKKL